MAKNKQKRLLIETKKGGTQSAVKSDKVQFGDQKSEASKDKINIF